MSKASHESEPACLIQVKEPADSQRSRYPKPWMQYLRRGHGEATAGRGAEYNYRQEAGIRNERALERRPAAEWSSEYGGESPLAQFAATCGTGATTYIRERSGMSAFVLEDGVVYHTYSTYARGLDGVARSGATQMLAGWRVCGLGGWYR